MFINRKFILGALYLSAATAQGQPGSLENENFIFFAQPTELRATEARVVGPYARGDGAPRDHLAGMMIKPIREDGEGLFRWAVAS
jgi:hypothetical protein